MKKTYLFAIFGLIVFILLWMYIGDGEETGLDLGITSSLDFLESYSSFFESFALLGSTKVIGFGSILLILWLWFKRKDFIGIATVLIVVGGGNLLNSFIKNLIERERPVGHISESFAFPSGHAMVGLLFYGILLYFILKGKSKPSLKITVKIIIPLIIFTLGLGRIPIHEHYPTDVLAGLGLGYFYFVICIKIYESWKGNSKS
jgi:undecaprenyl-diphosphatase